MKQCPYCGYFQNIKFTFDHVPPSSLIDYPENQEKIKWRICSKCHKNIQEESFIKFCRLAGNKTENMSNKWGPGEFVKELRVSPEIYTPFGKNIVRIKNFKNIFLPSMDKIFRGLYYYKTESPIPRKTCRIKILRPITDKREYLARVFNIFEDVRRVVTVPVINNVSAEYLYYEEEPSIIFGLFFYFEMRVISLIISDIKKYKIYLQSEHGKIFKDFERFFSYGLPLLFFP